jgi:hypothetical protein
MRNLFTIILLLTIGTSVLYVSALHAVCAVPITYALGTLDEQFGLSQEDALAILGEAEAVWEGPLETELFRYDPDSRFVVNFIYDERQRFSEAEFGFRQRLGTVEQVNDGVRAQYVELTRQYDELKESFEERSKAYEARLENYNREVEQFNAAGGAPPDDLERLGRESTALETERREINAFARQLNLLVEQINRVGEQGNLLVEQYNRGVGEYNETFGQSRQFTQGEYRGDSINIFSFTDTNELRLVLAHEFGHALGIDHAEGRESIMYYLIGEQPVDLALSEYDMAEYTAVCTDRSSWDTLVINARSVFNL